MTHDQAADFWCADAHGDHQYLGTRQHLGAPADLGRGVTVNTDQWPTESADPTFPMMFMADPTDRDAEYLPADFRRFAEAAATTSTWPHPAATSEDTPWCYIYRSGTVFAYHRGVEMVTIRCSRYTWKPDLDALHGQVFLTRKKFGGFPAITGVEL